MDLENQVLRLPDSQSGPKQVYLNGAAIKLLRSMPRMQPNPYVIVGKKVGARLINLQKPWRRIRARAGLDDVRIHDLRHSFASIAAGAGMSVPMIGKLLGHTQPATTARYAHLAADPLRAAADVIGKEITAAIAEESVMVSTPPTRLSASDSEFVSVFNGLSGSRKRDGNRPGPCFAGRVSLA